MHALETIVKRNDVAVIEAWRAAMVAGLIEQADEIAFSNLDLFVIGRTGKVTVRLSSAVSTSASR